MAQRLFLVDVEASAPTPYSGVMTEFGVVDFETREWFHGHLWEFHPDPEVPARPVAEREAPGWTRSDLSRHKRRDGPGGIHLSPGVDGPASRTR